MDALRIGLDFGGVIVRAASGTREDTALHDPAKQLDEPVPGAIDGVTHLVSASGGDVWIVSKAGPRMQARTLQWLDDMAFHSRTGLSKDHVRFCATREQKAPICEELGITHFVDDRVHVMQILRNIVPNLFLFQTPGHETAVPSWARRVTSWTEATALILEPRF